MTSTVANEKEDAQTEYDEKEKLTTTQYSTTYEITPKITKRQTTDATSSPADAASTTKAQTDSITTSHAISSMTPTTEFASQPEKSITDVTTVENLVTTETNAEMRKKVKNGKKSMHIAWIG